MNKLEALRDWLNQLPEGSEITCVETSIWEDDACIGIKTPDGGYDERCILGIEHNWPKERAIEAS